MGTGLLYLPVRHFEFLNYDDYEYVSENLQARAGLTLPGIRWAFAGVHSSNWHPLTWLAHMLDVDIWGTNAGGHHLTSAALHSINAALLFILFLTMTESVWRSAFVAAVFAWHPLHVESVAWVSERKDVLSTFFSLLATLAYVRYCRETHPRRYCLILLLFACALMSKPSAVTLPIFFLLLDYWPLHREKKAGSWQRLIIEKIPMLAMSAITAAITLWAQHSVAIRSLQQLPLRLRLLNAPISYINYLSESIWPANLAAFYPFPSQISWSQAIPQVILLLLITTMVVRLAKSHPYLFVGWFWFIVGLIPVIGLIQVGDQAMADRYMYTPLIGLSVALAWGVVDLARHWQIKSFWVGAIAGLALLACAATTAMQLPHWKDSFALYRRALRPAHNASGHPFFFDGLADALLRNGRLDEANDVMEQALHQFPENPKRLALAGKIQFQRGDTAEAEKLWRRALEINPNEYEAHNDLGVLYSGGKRWAEARTHFERLVELRPDDAIALGNLANLCFLTKDYKNAMVYCQRGLAASPGDPVLQKLKRELEREQWNEP